METAPPVSDNPHGLLLPPELDPRGSGRRPGRRRWVRVVSWVAVVTSVFLVVASGVGFALYRYYGGKIPRIPFSVGGNRPDKVPGRALNFLLIGSDSREGASKAELKRFATEFTAGRRSDTMILIHLSAKRDKVQLVSFPRDAFVTIPAHGKRAAHTGKINTAFSQGGHNLAAQTVEQLTGIRIDHYIEVNFAGFQRLVDAVDGVDVCLRKPAKDRLSGINLPAGRSRIRGTQALAFVRQREGLPRGDLDRIERQQQFLSAMMRRATSRGILLNPVRLVKFLNVATESLQIDTRLQLKNLEALARAMRGLDPRRVQFITAPVDRLAKRNRQSVVLLDAVVGREVYASIKADRGIPGAEPVVDPVPTKAAALTVPPSRIRLRVLNGTETKGLAAKTANELKGLGYRVSETGNADRTSYDGSIIRYGPDRQESAATLAAAIKGARLERDNTLASTLVLVVGRNYAGAKKVTVTARPASTGPTPSRAPVSTAADDPCA